MELVPVIGLTVLMDPIANQKYSVYIESTLRTISFPFLACVFYERSRKSPVLDLISFLLSSPLALLPLCMSPALFLINPLLLLFLLSLFPLLPSSPPTPMGL